MINICKNLFRIFFVSIFIFLLLTSCGMKKSTSKDENNGDSTQVLEENNQSIINVIPIDSSIDLTGKLVFQQVNQGKNDIFLWDFDLNKLTMITNSGDNVEPSFSEDGEKIIYSCKNIESNYYDICIFDLSKNENELFFQSDYDKWGAQISPDGNQVIFVSNQNPYAHLQLINTDDKKVLDLFHNSISNQSSPKWSKDSETIYFIDDENGFNIYKGSIKTSLKEKITNFNLDDRPDIDFSNNTIVFRRLFKNSSFFDGNEIFMIDLSTNEETQLTDDEIGQDWPIFSPDGKFLLMTYKIDTRTLLRILDIQNNQLYSIGEAEINGYAGDWTK